MGIYDFKLGRQGEIFSPCQCLYNVYAWGTDQRVIAFGTDQRPTVALPFLSNLFPLSTPPSQPSSTTTTTHGRVRIGTTSTELQLDAKTNEFSFVAPIVSRGTADLSMSYSPDGLRYVIMPNIKVVVFDISGIEPPQAAVGVATTFTVRGGPFDALQQGASIAVQFLTLLPTDYRLPGDGAAVNGVSNGNPITVKEIASDYIKFTATLQASGALFGAFTVTDRSAGGPSVHSAWPALYDTILEKGKIPSTATSQAQPWPRILDAYGIHVFEPLFTRTLGNTVISMHLQDPKLSVPQYLVPSVELDTIRVRFESQHVYASAAGAVPQRDSSDEHMVGVMDGTNTDTFVKSLTSFVPSTSVYVKEGWADLPDSKETNDIGAVIRVRAPRVEKPGVYAIELSINGSPAFAPVIGNQRIFFYELGGVLTNNSVYAMAGKVSPDQVHAVVLSGQFLPPFNHKLWWSFHSLMTSGAKLKVGPLTSDGQSTPPLIVSTPSVTSTSITFRLPANLPPPEVNKLYMQVSTRQPP